MALVVVCGLMAVIFRGPRESLETALKRSGFLQVRLEFNEGPHGVDPRPLQRALEWFCELAAPPAPTG